jgi:hypothetical protein
MNIFKLNLLWFCSLIYHREEENKTFENESNLPLAMITLRECFSVSDTTVLWSRRKKQGSH